MSELFPACHLNFFFFTVAQLVHVADLNVILELPIQKRVTFKKVNGTLWKIQFENHRKWKTFQPEKNSLILKKKVYGLTNEWLDGCMAWQMDGHGWMDGLMQDQPNVRPDSGTTRLTHDHTHARPETHDQTHAWPDSRTTRLTQDQTHARHVCNNYSNELYLSKSIAVLIN